MKFTVFAYYDKELQCTGKPNLETAPKEDVVEGVARAIYKCDPNKDNNLDNFKGKKLIILGVYDDNNGFKLTDPENQFKDAYDLDVIIQERFGKYEQQTD